MFITAHDIARGAFKVGAASGHIYLLAFFFMPDYSSHIVMLLLFCIGNSVKLHGNVQVESCGRVDPYEHVILSSLTISCKST